MLSSIGAIVMAIGAAMFVAGIIFLAWVSSSASNRLITEVARAEIGRNVSIGTIVTFIGILMFGFGGFALVTSK